MKTKLTSLILMAGCVLGVTACSNKENADTVLYGTFYTGEEVTKDANAVAIKNEKIIFVGKKEDAKKYVGKDTKEQEFSSEKLITAGLVDAHTHVAQLVAAKYNSLGQIPAGANKAKCLEVIEKYVQDNPNLNFYNLTGWEMQNFSDQPYGCPEAVFLDGITTKPIICHSSDGHSYWVNNTMMSLAGVTRDTQLPVPGGTIRKYDNGEPLGVFDDTAEYLIDNVVPEKSQEVWYKGIKGADQMCLEQGYVNRFQALDNMAFNSWKYPEITYSEQLDKAGLLRGYTQGSFIINNTADAFELVDTAINLRDSTKGGDYELTNVKIFLDGIIENAGAYVSEPYNVVEHVQDKQDYYGTQRWPGNDALIKMGHIIAKANKANMPVHFHCMGDQALSDALTAIEYASNEVGIDVVRNARNAIAHLALVKDSDYDRMKNLDVIATLNPWGTKGIEAESYYPLQAALLGQERADKQYPYKSFLDHGVKVAFGTDLGASFTYNSIECFNTLATRRNTLNEESSILGKESEKLSREETLKAMTSGGAYQLHKENDLGTISVGKDASFTLFSKNLLTIEDKDIMSTKVEGTMFKGNWEYVAK